MLFSLINHCNQLTSIYLFSKNIYFLFFSLKINGQNISSYILKNIIYIFIIKETVATWYFYKNTLLLFKLQYCEK